MFGAGNQKYKINWKFSQKGNIWSIKFAGNSIICGETRITDSKETYLFAININSGECLLQNYVYEKDNFWITLEEASSKYIFLSRIEKPGMPNHKGIIVLDLLGNKIWENTELEYIYNDEQSVAAYSQNFESIDVFRLNIDSGEIENKFPSEQTREIFSMREKIISCKYDEINDYPLQYGNETGEPVKDIMKIEITDKIAESSPEFIERDDIVIFNYYRNKGTDLKDITRKIYKNIICIYDKVSKKLLYRDILNEDTLYCVPDNFFTKDGYLYYIKEKNKLINIKL